MKYLLSIVLLALIGVTTPKKTTPAYDWGSVIPQPELSGIPFCVFRSPLRPHLIGPR